MRFSSIREGFTLIAPAASTLDIPSAIACSVCATARSVVVLRLLLESESLPAGCEAAEGVGCSGVFAGGGVGGGVKAPSSADCTAEGWLCCVSTGAASEDVDRVALRFEDGTGPWL